MSERPLTVRLRIVRPLWPGSITITRLLVGAADGVGFGCGLGVALGVGVRWGEALGVGVRSADSAVGLGVSATEAGVALADALGVGVADGCVPQPAMTTSAIAATGHRFTRPPYVSGGPDQLNADSPVSAWPITSWCTSEVPS